MPQQELVVTNAYDCPCHCNQLANYRIGVCLYPKMCIAMLWDTVLSDSSGNEKRWQGAEDIFSNVMNHHGGKRILAIN